MPHVPYTPTIQPRDAVMRFAEAMEKGLRENEHKGSWAGTDSRVLANKATNTIADQLYPFELYIARGGFDPMAAVDAANYLMMLFDNEVSKNEL